jgi:hypothetical protein
LEEGAVVLWAFFSKLIGGGCTSAEERDLREAALPEVA